MERVPDKKKSQSHGQLSHKPQAEALTDNTRLQNDMDVQSPSSKGLGNPMKGFVFGKVPQKLQQVADQAVRQRKLKNNNEDIFERMVREQ